MNTLRTSTWWRRNRRPLGGLLLGLVAAAGMFAVVDVMPRLQPESGVEHHIADSPQDIVSVAQTSIGPVTSQFFPDDVVAFSDPPPGSQSLWVKVIFDNAPATCTLRLTEVGGQGRTWLSAIPLLTWDAPDDAPAYCAGREGEDFGLLNAFALPQDAPGPFTLEVITTSSHDLLTRVVRFPIAPTLAEG